MEFLKEIILGLFDIIIILLGIAILALFILAFGSSIYDEIKHSRLFNKLLLRLGIILNEDYFFDHVTWGDIKTVKRYIKAGIDINKQDGWRGETALMRAAQRGNIPLINILLDAGANAKLISEDRWSASMFAASKDNVEATRILAAAERLQSGGELTSFFLSAASNLEGVIDVFLKSGEDLNQKDKDGNTALMYAAAIGNNIETVKKLLSWGAVVDEKNHDGVTALDIAEKANHDEIVTILKEAYKEDC